MKSVLEFSTAKQTGHQISMLTCYDYWTAKILSETDVDCLLVGDSAAMVMHGHKSTVHATIEMMETHISAVAKGASDKLVIGDLPFMSYRKSLDSSLAAAERLVRAGAVALKLEGCTGNEALIERLVESGIPVVGHLGLTPQSANALGGHKVQGRDENSAQQIEADAKELESLGCFTIVLECVPAELGKHVTDQLTVPTIGIGSGPSTSGQVLVLQDMLGSDQSFNPKFLRRFANLEQTIAQAVNEYHQNVATGSFPNDKESYS